MSRLSRTISLSIFFLSVILLSALPVHAKTGTLSGRVVDVDTGDPVGFVYLLIEEIHFWQPVKSDGTFQFKNIPAGRHQVKTYRFGYSETMEIVFVSGGSTTEITFQIAATPMAVGDVVVSGHRVHKDSTLENPDIVVADRKLRQNLGMTLAKTLENEPGMDHISMGPAPARPVLRGLGGDRLLILEDGERTGDLSATSADHAVSIDPMTTSRIEVIRGPEALIYGANALGGVINVVREAVPRSLPAKLSGSGTLQSESVNRGNAGALDIRIPVGSIAIRSDFNFRNSEDVQTPEGILKNTGIQTLNTSLGLSIIREWGYLGISGGFYDTEYGIPPDPSGGHPKGVDIEMLRQHVTTEGQYNLTLSMIRHLFIKHQYSRYQHQEIESSGTIGMEFGVVTHNLSAILHFCECGPLTNARIGFWGEHRDYASGGLTFTPTTRELSTAVYLYNEFIRGRWSVNGTLRFDAKSVNPDEDYFSRQAGHIRNRQFYGASWAVSGHYHMLPNFIFGATVMHTFRAPGVEELFSEGPHLAAYSYEVGNADLEKETGLGLEIFTEYEFDNGLIRISAFQNDLKNYIFPRNTGERSWRRADLFLYQYSGLHALMTGYEISGKWMLLPKFSISTQLQYVRGELVDENLPIPRMPPLTGSIGLHYQNKSLSVILNSKGTERQNRIDEFETPTDGFLIHNLTIQYLLSKGGMLHTFSLTVENIADIKYRRHLNRVKDIMPEPGRNFRLLYKVFF